MSKTALILLGIAAALFVGLPFYFDFMYNRRMARMKSNAIRQALADKKLPK